MSSTTTPRPAMVEGIPARAYAGFGACIYPSDKNVLDHHHFLARHGRGHSCPVYDGSGGLHLPLGQECSRPPPPRPDKPWSRAFLPECTTALGAAFTPRTRMSSTTTTTSRQPWSRAFLPECTTAPEGCIASRTRMSSPINTTSRHAMVEGIPARVCAGSEGLPLPFEQECPRPRP